MTSVIRLTRCAQLLVQNQLSDLGVNEYDWITDCYHNDALARHELPFDEYRRAMRVLKQRRDPQAQGVEVDSEVTVLCVDSHGAYVYMNMPSVQRALHIRNASAATEWNICSDELQYDSLAMYDDLAWLYREMLEMDDQLYVMVYNGDVDPGINVLGSEWFVDDLGAAPLSGYAWREWFVDGENGKQVGGWTENFERVSFVSVRGAGHMVPQFKPVAALKMIDYFLQNKPLQ